VLTISILATTALPAAALTPPALTLRDNANNSLTIDSTGAINCVGACTTTSSSVVPGSGTIIWSGTVGDFNISNANGRTKPALTAPAMDIGTSQVSAGSIGGTLTITFGDTDFSGSGPVYMNMSTTLFAGGSVAYSSYIDGGNGLFGTATLVGTTTSSGTGDTQSLSGAASLVDNSFSMTAVAAITLPPGGFMNNDDSLAASPAPPLTLTCANSSAQVGLAYSSSLTAGGGVPGYTYSISSGALPNGLTLNTANGAITGTPSLAGNFAYTAQVTDSLGHTAATPSCGINVLAGTTPLNLKCPTPTTAMQGQFFSSSLVASGGKAPYQYAITGGICNASVDGLSLNATTGAISGMPKTPATYNFSAKVTDSLKPSTSAYASCSLTIVAPVFAAPVVHGDTATIGFWHNSNGQMLISSMNGSAFSTSLANWLATQFPNLYGAKSPNNLTGKTNMDVANLFSTYFNITGQKTKAQILAGALAVYATDSDLGGTTAKTYGFNSSSTGTGGKTYNVGANGKAILLNNNQAYTVMALLQQANLTTQNNTFSSGDFNTVFNAINQAGDIK
jgi:hypothetical protein